MWQAGWRDEIWANLDQDWDCIVIGGGITGAGIMCEASYRGLKTLLVERNDFASGTSSRSSKLVHGGLRYLKNFQIKVTFDSVAEREFLINHAAGLVNRMDILFASQKGDKYPGWIMGVGLIAYSLMAGNWHYAHHNPAQIKALCPLISSDRLIGGFQFADAQTDDARLTLRVIQEAVRSGGMAINYARVVDLLRDHRGRVCGVALEDQAPGSGHRNIEVLGKVVINATGAWSDQVRSKLDLSPRLRPLRGSHLVFPHSRLPLKQSINVNHPTDGRPVFVFPWEGVTIAGTTDVDVGEGIPVDPGISEAEADYLLKFIQDTFPGQGITGNDIISTWSGIRPVINTGKLNPSEESREHAIWTEGGMITVTGGKLTTFRVMAHDTLRIAGRRLGMPFAKSRNCPIFQPINEKHITQIKLSGLDEVKTQRLVGRLGIDCVDLLASAHPGELEHIPSTSYLWAELRWAAMAEGVIHLDDLLLRRIRLGVLLPGGGAELLPKIRAVVQPGLGWSDARWQEEESTYRELWERAYKPVL